MATEPAGQGCHVEAGSDADDDSVAQFADERCNRFLHLLRFDGEHQNVGCDGGAGGALMAIHAIGSGQLGACFGARVDGINVAGREALLEHAADQGVGHVAAAKENNLHL